MRLHLVSLPHTQVSPAFCGCAYTAKVYKFVKMMRGDYEILLYAPDGPEVPGATLIPCLSNRRRQEIFGKDDPGRLFAWPTDAEAVEFNNNVSAALHEKLKPRELVLSAAGLTHLSIMQKHPSALWCEPFCGYEGIMTDKVAFESYAHMHRVYALRGLGDGRWFDAVIPNYFDPDEFISSREPTGEPYLLYLGRVIQRKGVAIAGDIAKHAGIKLVIAGAGAKQVGPDVVAPEVTVPNATYAGPVGVEQRAHLLANATALVCPTIYLEPFGGVAVEAMMSGCPVIATDWGAFSETVPSTCGVRFRTLKEGIDAVERVKNLDRQLIQTVANSRYSLRAVRPRFKKWLDQVNTLWDKGWYQGVNGSNDPINEDHLGGYVKGGDPATFYPDLWKWLVETFEAHKVLDLGCGEGHAMKVFRDLGCDVTGIDGVPQKDPAIQVIDFTKRAYCFAERFDLTWCCEFVEHVEERFMRNFVPAFGNSKVVAMTHAEPGQAGHHHVNCRDADYWKGVMAGQGLRFDQELTDKARAIAAANTSPWNHFKRSGMIFVR